MSPPRLDRRAFREKPHHRLPVVGEFALERGRAHELCGAARRTLAIQVAARTEGPVFWIAPSWTVDRLNAEALARLMPPARLVLVEPDRAEDVLWAMEEVLRAGLALAVADLPGPPGLVSVRRLHLAAEEGATQDGSGRNRPAPLALLLTPGAGGAPGVETRWRADPDHRPGQRGWRLERLRARMAPERVWRMEPRGAGMALAPWVEGIAEPA